MPPASAPERTTRAHPKALFLVAGLLLAARLGTGLYEHYRPPRPGGLVRWASPAEAESLAAGGRKPILYDFSAVWCAPCKQMDRELFSDPGTAEFINDTFIAVRVRDEDTSAASTAIRRRHEVNALPTMVVVHPDSKEPRRIRGYAGKRQMLAFLRAAAIAGRSGF